MNLHIHTHKDFGLKFEISESYIELKTLQILKILLVQFLRNVYFTADNSSMGMSITQAINAVTTPICINIIQRSISFRMLKRALSECF